MNSTEYPTHKCIYCTRMVNFGPGQVCGECIQNNMAAVEESIKKKTMGRELVEYRHPAYRGHDVLKVDPPQGAVPKTYKPNAKELRPVGNVWTDSRGRVWVRVK